MCNWAAAGKPSTAPTLSASLAASGMAHANKERVDLVQNRGHVHLGERS